MLFRCSIPTTNRAFQLSGARADLRVTFQVPEMDLPAALPLVLHRGSLFRVKVHEDREPTEESPLMPEVKGIATISPTSRAIAIDGEAGMMLTLSFPSESSSILTGLLKLRERSLVLEIDENSFKKV